MSVIITKIQYPHNNIIIIYERQAGDRIIIKLFTLNTTQEYEYKNASVVYHISCIAMYSAHVHTTYYIIIIHRK